MALISVSTVAATAVPVHSIAFRCGIGEPVVELGHVNLDGLHHLGRAGTAIPTFAPVNESHIRHKRKTGGDLDEVCGWREGDRGIGGVKRAGTRFENVQTSLFVNRYRGPLP